MTELHADVKYICYLCTTDNLLHIYHADEKHGIHLRRIFTYK